MKAFLDKIESWLLVNAERIIKYSLRPPADKSHLDALESLTDKALPKDFRELYLWHDGSDNTTNLGSLFYGFDFLSIDEVKRRYTSFVDTIKDYPLELKTEEKINHKNAGAWVQFTSDGARSGLFLDLEPSEKGKYGQVIYVDLDYDIAFVVAESISSLVRDTVVDMENGYYFLNEDALEDGDHWLDTHSDIDVTNWHKSTRWKIGNQLSG